MPRNGYLCTPRQLIGYEDALNKQASNGWPYWAILLKLIEEAAYQDSVRIISNHKYCLKRGQFIVALTYGQTLLGFRSVQGVRTVLDYLVFIGCLRREGFITQVQRNGQTVMLPARRGTVTLYTIENYDEISEGKWAFSPSEIKAPITPAITENPESSIGPPSLPLAKTEVIQSKQSKEKESGKFKTGTRLEQHVSAGEGIPREWAEWSFREFGWSDQRSADTFEEFRDYWNATAGIRGKKCDWFATWRNWCRRQSQSPRRTDSQGNKHLDSKAATVLRGIMAGGGRDG